LLPRYPHSALGVVRILKNWRPGLGEGHVDDVVANSPQCTLEDTLPLVGLGEGLVQDRLSFVVGTAVLVVAVTTKVNLLLWLVGWRRWLMGEKNSNRWLDYMGKKKRVWYSGSRSTLVGNPIHQLL